jgi:Zn-dependent protease with chaperone function
MTRGWLSVLVVVSCAVPALAQPTPPKSAADVAFEQRARGELATVSEEAAKAFDEANAARDAGRYDDAATAYRRVVAAAPNVDHGHRRLCGVLSFANKHDEAVTECRRALELAPASIFDKSALAAALAQRKNPGDIDQATALARESAHDPDADANVVQTWCQVMILARQDAEVTECADRLIALAPDALLANLLGAVTAATRGDFELAHQRLEKAHRLGLPDDRYEDLRSKMAEDERRADERRNSIAGVPIPMTFLSVVLWIMVVWLGGMVLLLGAGYALSRMQLRALADPEAAARGGARERRLRGVYRAVLALSGVYFYLSLPLVLLAVVLAGAGAILAFLVAGVIPIKLVLIIGIVVLATAGAIVRSLTVRVRPEKPGEPLELADHPQLRTLLVDVATTVGTRPVDAVYLTPGTEMAVTERLGVWGSLRHKRAERSLIMGIGLFDGMTQLQLRSILAHEHGHFRNEDTAGGGFALQVRQSLFAFIVQLARAGAAGWFNPAWWFLRGYFRVYLGMSQGASRLQEVLADRWAVEAYGSQAFVAGYRHVVTRSVEFSPRVSATINEVAERKAPLPNLYQYRAEAAATSGDDIAAKIAEELAREPDLYDSHPSSKQRIAWAEAMAVAREPQPADTAAVWELFADREAIERAMTAEIRERVHARTGVEIPAEPAAEQQADDES